MTSLGRQSLLVVHVHCLVLFNPNNASYSSLAALQNATRPLRDDPARRLAASPWQALCVARGTGRFWQEPCRGVQPDAAGTGSTAAAV